MSSDHLVVVEKLSDFRWNDADIEVITAERFIAERPRIRRRPGKVINLCRSYSYLSIGYYCSLLAEARGDRVTPSVEMILDLQRKKLQAASLPTLNRLVGSLKEVPRSVKSLTLHVFFGEIEDQQLAALARKSFELFRCPLLEIELERSEKSDGWQISGLHPLEPRDVDPDRDEAFVRGLAKFTRRAWKPTARPRTYRMDLAILHDPKDPLPPSNLRTLKHISDIAETMDISVELIEKKDFSRLTQFDALFIRETTAVSHHTFQFARMAESEGMPAIDDPTSILRCTNKAFLAELLRENGVATPKTYLLSRQSLSGFGFELSYPVVLKVPDGAFSRSVKKAEDAGQLQEIAQEMFKESDVILVQEFMYTEFDWRIGILDGEPLFAAQYHMCRDHWQIIKHSSDGESVEGHVEAILLTEVPEGVLKAACKSASLVGDRFYGVDIKEKSGQAFVIEINDNPNLDAGVEDARQGDEVYRKILSHLLSKFECRFRLSPTAEASEVEEDVAYELLDKGAFSMRQNVVDSPPSAYSSFTSSAGSQCKILDPLLGSALRA